MSHIDNLCFQPLLTGCATSGDVWRSIGRRLALCRARTEDVSPDAVRSIGRERRRCRPRETTSLRRGFLHLSAVGCPLSKRDDARRHRQQDPERGKGKNMQCCAGGLTAPRGFAIIHIVRGRSVETESVNVVHVSSFPSPSGRGEGCGDAG